MFKKFSGSYQLKCIFNALLCTHPGYRGARIQEGSFAFRLPTGSYSQIELSSHYTVCKNNFMLFNLDTTFWRDKLRNILNLYFKLLILSM